jgi:DNA (cytosine-5)-methyltransferase 1
MKYLSVCSGIEAASVAWHELGWTPVGFSEIEKFPSGVLHDAFPDVPNYGDMTQFKEWPIERGSIDVIVGGTPCQAFSVAGLRKGLDDPRGNLSLTFVSMVEHFKPEFFIWENVPGVLSSSGGRDFGSLLTAVGYIGYGWAYRVLDAQYFGVPQRRRRVFLVGHISGDPRRAGEILFEQESLRWDNSPSRKKTEGITSATTTGSVSCKWAKGTGGPAGDEAYNLVTVLYDHHPNDSRIVGPVSESPTVAARWGTGGNNVPIVQHTMQPLAFEPGSIARNAGPSDLSPLCPTLRADMGDNQPAVIALAENTIGRQPMNGGNGDGFTVGGPMYTLNATGVHGICQTEEHKSFTPSCVRLGNEAHLRDTTGTILASQAKNGDNQPLVLNTVQMLVRRLMPIECERLQGFPDNWTDIQPRGKPTPDSPRYKAIGNSMAVPVMKWIGKRIDQKRNQEI